MAEDGLMEGEPVVKKKIKEEKILKERKKHDRFNGMPEEEVSKRTLPDHLATNLDIVIVSFSLRALSTLADIQILCCRLVSIQVYSPPTKVITTQGQEITFVSQNFIHSAWAMLTVLSNFSAGKCLYMSGITPEPMTSDDDHKMLKLGVGFTNMVSRATKGSADLTRKEIKEGCNLLTDKLKKYKPKIAVFNGKLIYEVFSGKKDFPFGRQADFVDGTNTVRFFCSIY